MSDDPRQLLDCVSDCCGAKANSDYMICSECKEHCDIYYEDEEENLKTNQKHYLN